MENKKCYLDSCIWLNLFKKESDSTSGVQWWKLTKDFIEQVEERDGKVIVSTIVLKELYFKTKDKFNRIQKFFKESEYIEIVKTTSEDYELARKWEQEHGLLSFYDYIHVAITKRLNIQLITRDKDLIEFAKSYVEVFKPEDLIR
ncbi:MAG: PIN domain-containing protein [Nanoarchaeota archaeon]|nr:PIN domain-containing protein [Nanoarchaeota archaeon]MBU1103273.1 PIN domain-containing protein [Nanoarchaeota archaeon]